MCKRGDIVYSIEPNRKQLRRKYGKDAERIAAAVENLTTEEIAAIASKLSLRENVEISGCSLSDQELSLLTDTAGFMGVVSHGIAVEVATVITPDLADEGLARELVHRIQFMRRSAGFDISDYIETCYSGGEAIQRVMTNYASYIQQETLSRTLSQDNPSDGAFVESHKIEGQEVTLAVKKLSC